MFSRSIDTLEQREALIDLVDRNFASGPRTCASTGVEPLPHRRTRRQTVLVRGNRIARRS